MKTRILSNKETGKFRAQVKGWFRWYCLSLEEAVGRIRVHLEAIDLINNPYEWDVVNERDLLESLVGTGVITPSTSRPRRSPRQP